MNNERPAETPGWCSLGGNEVELGWEVEVGVAGSTVVLLMVGGKVGGVVVGDSVDSSDERVVTAVSDDVESVGCSDTVSPEGEVVVVVVVVVFDVVVVVVGGEVGRADVGVVIVEFAGTDVNGSVVDVMWDVEFVAELVEG